MFANWTEELDKDGDEYFEIENLSADDHIDVVAESFESDNTPINFIPVNGDAEIRPEERTMGSTTIDDSAETEDDENLYTQNAEVSDEDEQTDADSQQEDGYEDVLENDETEHLVDDITEMEEYFQDEEEFETENTDVETDLQNSESLFDQNDDLDDADNDDFADSLEEIDDFLFTEDAEDDTITNYDDADEQSDTNSFDGEQLSEFGDGSDLQVEDDMRHGERGDLEISLASGEWMQDESDLPDEDLGSELQLQFDSLSEINTNDSIFDFNFDDAGFDNTNLFELDDLESDDAVNMLDDLNTDLLIDDEFSDVNSRF